MEGVVWDRIFDALRHEHRRQLLAALQQQDPNDEGLQIPEDIEVDEIELQVLQAQLIHTHLPKLEEAGYVQWGRDQHIVTRGPKFDEIQSVLELLHEQQDALPTGWP